jgi:hypothetical protein
MRRIDDKFLSDAILDRSVAAWHRHCRRRGVIGDQPSRSLSNPNGWDYYDPSDVVELANSRGIMARFRVGATGRVSMLREGAR